MDPLQQSEGVPMFGVALISSDSINGQRVLYRYPIEFCGPEVTSKFQTPGDYSGWKRFAQLFNPFVKTKNIVVSIGDQLSMIPRCIISTQDKVNGDSTAVVIVFLVNMEVVSSSFDLQSFEDCATHFSNCLLKVEEMSGFLSQEKAILLGVLNEFKQVRKQQVLNHASDDQLILNVQLERSLLAKELSQLYHELNRYHHTSILLQNSIPFIYTIPSYHKPFSCVQFHTTENRVSEINLEPYYALLLFYDPSYYRRAVKTVTASFFDRFITLASPFLSFETMSARLEVPIQKIFATALSLQRANTASIIMTITASTRFAIVPELSHTSESFASHVFDSRFKELGPLSNILAVIANTPPLDRVFPQYGLSQMSYEARSASASIVYDAILWLLQHRVILPIAIHAQFLPDYTWYMPHKLEDEEERRSDFDDGPNHMSMHFASEGHPMRKAVSALTTSTLSPGSAVLDSSYQDVSESFTSRLSQKMKNSIYYNYHISGCGSSCVDMIERHNSFTATSGELAGERSREQIWKGGMMKSGSTTSIPNSNENKAVEAENRKIRNRNLLEKCIPLMNDHYCIDELCYKLSISHAIFWDIVLEYNKQFFIFYVINDK